MGGCNAIGGSLAHVPQWHVSRQLALHEWLDAKGATAAIDESNAVRGLHGVAVREDAIHHADQTLTSGQCLDHVAAVVEHRRGEWLCSGKQRVEYELCRRSRGRYA